MPKLINNKIIDRNENKFSNVALDSKVVKLRNFLNGTDSEILEVKIPPVLFKKSLSITENYLHLKLEKKAKFNKENITIENFWGNLFSIILKSKSFSINQNQNLSILGFENSLKKDSFKSPYLNLESIPIYFIENRFKNLQAGLDSKIWIKKREDIILPVIANNGEQILCFSGKKEAELYLKYLNHIDPFGSQKNQIFLASKNLKFFYEQWKTGYPIFTLIHSFDKKKNSLFVSKELIKLNKKVNVFLVSFSRDVLEASLKKLGYNHKNYKKCEINSFFTQIKENCKEEYLFIPDLNEKKNNINKSLRIQVLKPDFFPAYLKAPFLACFNETIMNVSSLDRVSETIGKPYDRLDYLFPFNDEGVAEHPYTTNRWYKKNFISRKYFKSLRYNFKKLIPQNKISKTLNGLLFNVINFKRLDLLKYSKSMKIPAFLSRRSHSYQLTKDFLIYNTKINHGKLLKKKLSLKKIEKDIQRKNKKFQLEKKKEIELPSYLRYYEVLFRLLYRKWTNGGGDIFSPYSSILSRKKKPVWKQKNSNLTQKRFIINSLFQKTKEKKPLVRKFSSSYPIYSFFYQSKAKKINLPLEYNLDKKSRTNIFKAYNCESFINAKYSIKNKN